MAKGGRAANEAAAKTTRAAKRAAVKGGNEIMHDPEVQIEQALGKTEAWFEKHWKIVIIIVAAVLVAVAAVYAYEGLYKVPQGRKAAQAMFVAEQLFAAENYEQALNGDGTNLGFVDVVDKFRGTREARLAAHYAGISFMKQGDLDSALEYLAKYKPVRGVVGEIINAQNQGLRGDIYVQKDDVPAAIEAFRKAVDASDNELTAPMYLKKLGLALEENMDYAGALEAYRRIETQYPSTPEGRDIAKYISAVEQKLQ